MWEAEVSLHSFLTSALDGGDWSTSYASRFTPAKGTSTHWMRLGGPQRRSGRLEEEKISAPTEIRVPHRQAVA